MHLTRIYRKPGIRGRTELAALFAGQRDTDRDAKP
ncbi:hypothetical protein Ga0074812_107294 [Parafrankia irregularis]|uniref:Uncharacterized protein n=1 Tax=Parafrankia irregularis TaxID=795642 RepID=A0A0S4QPI6_9ACTN|nr:hypothetical protein Ga0074812_107294 [Parafrankia irregularis]